jgi:hypothetical protein
MELISEINNEDIELLINTLENEINNLISVRDRTNRNYWNQKIEKLQKLIVKLKN